jgi:putative sterol carrier protein
MAVTSAQEIFEKMASQFKPEVAGDMTATIQFELSGEGGGQWVASIANGQATVTAGTTPNPTMTFMSAAADYVAIINGTLNPMNAFMQGKIKVKGDMAMAMKMQKMFGG